MYNSIVRNNRVYNEDKGIFVSASHNNQISNNTISKSRNGIHVGSDSSNNNISGNTITNSTSQAIHTIFLHSIYILPIHSSTDSCLPANYKKSRVLHK
jgi:parallel beta-helix repeat protein